MRTLVERSSRGGTIDATKGRKAYNPVAVAEAAKASKVYASGLNFARFEGMPPKGARDLMNPGRAVRLDPGGRQNRSPVAIEMVRLAEQHDGTLEGYVIGGKRGGRVSVDGVTIRADDATAESLFLETAPDEYGKVSPGKYRYWWD